MKNSPFPPFPPLPRRSQTQAGVQPLSSVKGSRFNVQRFNSSTVQGSTVSAPVPSRHTSPGTFSLQKGLGFWELTFAGQHAVLKHEQGLFYVAYLLTNPPDAPIHGLALTLRTSALYRRPGTVTEILDPLTGKFVLPGIDSRLEERGLAFDAAEAAAALRRKQLQLEAILDDAHESEPVKAEVLRELQDIYNFQKANPSHTTDAAQKAVRAVRMAIKRFHRRIATATDANANPHPVLVPFAAHLEKHLLIPSARYSSRKSALARDGLVGCFTYEPPPGVIWLR